MSFCERMAPQTMAASYQMSAAARPVVDCAFQAEHTIHMPPCAIAAVPASCQLHAASRGLGEATYPEVLVQGLSLRLARVASTPEKRLFFTLPRGAAATLAGTPVADAIVNSGVCVTVCDAEACTLQ